MATAAVVQHDELIFQHPTMKQIAFLLFGVYSSIASAEISTELLCFDSSDKKPVQFEMRIYSDSVTGWSAGFVKYKKSKIQIPIVLKYTEAEVNDKNRPSKLTTSWLEISNNRVSGEYEMTSQGAGVYSMTYKSAATKKKYNFLLNTNVRSSEKTGCEWVDEK